MSFRLAPRLIVTSFALVLASGNLSAAAMTTIHVDDDAPGDPGPGDPLVSDPGEDGSVAHPYDTIAEAVSVAQAGDVVLLAVGRYAGVGNRNVLLTKAITVRSKYGAQSCAIDGEGNGNAFTVIGASPAIRGVTIRNGFSFSGGGIRVVGGASPTITQCVFEGNDATWGGALYCENSSPDVRQCVFTSNTATDGAGVCIRLGSFPLLVHCTFSGNSAQTGGALYAADSSVTTVENCILWGDQATGSGPEIFVGFDSGGVTVTVAASDVQGGFTAAAVQPGATLTWATTNIDAAPVFADVVTGDIHLLAGSPAIDGGDSSFGGAFPEDHEGDPRVVGADADMGADEFVPRLYVTGDRSPGGMVHVKAVGPPNAAPVLLLASTALLPTPVGTTFGDFHLDVPLVLVSLGALPSSGLLDLPMTIPASVPTGGIVFTQALISTTLSVPEVVLLGP